MTWTYRNKIVNNIPPQYIGFVYIITNNTNGRQYIGKKLAKFKKVSYKMVTQKTGLKKKKKFYTFVESDWRDYWSSSDKLKSDVQTLGEENFSRKILKYCTTHAELSYTEAKLMFSHDVLLNESKWYNGWIFVRVRQAHLRPRDKNNEKRSKRK